MEIFLNYMSPFPDFSKLAMQLSEPQGVRIHYNQHDILLEAYILLLRFKGRWHKERGNHKFKLKSHILCDQAAKFIEMFQI